MKYGYAYNSKKWLSWLILLTISLIISQLGFTQTKPAQKPAPKTTTATKAPIKTPNLTCNEYFPLTHKMSQTYLLTSAKQGTGVTAAYKATYNYYEGKPRVIMGIPSVGIIRDEFLEKLDVKVKDKWAGLGSLFSVASLKKQARFYYACTEGPESAFMEATEILEQTSTVVGSYTQVTETYKKGWMVPYNIKEEEIPEVEYNRVGSGRFNARVLTGSWFHTEPKTTASIQWEKRLPMGEFGESHSFEHLATQILEILPTFVVLGKTYNHVMHTVDSIFEKEKDAKIYGRLVCERHNYYAKGIGLVKSETWDTYQLTPDDPARLINNLFDPNAGVPLRTYTYLEMLPSKDADALKLVDLSRGKVVSVENEWQKK